MNTTARLFEAFQAAGGDGYTLERLIPGRRFLLARVRSPDGELLGGLASSRAQNVASVPSDAGEAARWLANSDPSTAAVGLATINAVLNHPLLAQDATGDGVDWLLEAGAGQHVALIGRFPFIEDELRPVVGELSVFELEPREGEYGAGEMAGRLPAAQVLAITATTLLNHTLDGILEHRAPGAQTLLLGPSTPLSPALFELGLDHLAGVVVSDAPRVTRDVEAGVTFRHLGGTTRVMVSRPVNS